MFEDLKNQIDFFIRNKTRFSRRNFVEKDPQILERNRLENLYIKDLLENSFHKKTQNSLKVLDIGCKNWFYAKGEYNFFNKFCPEIQMDGIEIDAYRLYSNFYSRYEVAKYYISGLKGVKYIAGNLLDLNQKYNYITWFLPFVIEDPHIYWGLPKKYFTPEKMLLHAYSLLEKDGQMLIINQGEEEFELQKELLNKLNIPYKTLGEIFNKYSLYKHKRFGIIINKP